jgi:hypothetical protein
MNPLKFKITEDKLLINYKFYCFLKGLNRNPKLYDTEVSQILETYYSNKHLAFDKLKVILINLIEDFKGIKNEKLEKLNTFLSEMLSYKDLQVFIFALKLMQIKPLLYEEAKLSQTSEIFKLEGLNQLSIAYDNISKSKPYYTRVNGALLSLLFFEKIEAGETNFLADSTQQYLKLLVEEYKILAAQKLEPNQIFMLMFSESINQGIISDAGSSYEDRVFNILIGIGIEPNSITKVHDVNDKSSEYDFFFNLDGKKFGLGAKRTLRERYKQFIKTAQSSHIDVMVEITLGLDLTLEKAKTIRQHNVYLIVADEIYYSRKYLQEIGGIFPSSEFSIDILKSLGDHT